MSENPENPPTGFGAPPPPAVPATPGAPVAAAPGTGTTLPRRSPGHRGQDQRDTVAEMMQKAHEISLEAGSKMATVMKDVIFAAAGLTPFAAESAKDLVNYMVRRGQMGAEEAERIRRDIEAAAEKRGAPKPGAKPVATPPSPFARTSEVAAAAAPPRAVAAPAPAAPSVNAPAKAPEAKKPVAKATAPKPKTAPAKAAPAKAAPKKPAAKKK